jgi:hypothetical protein
MSDTPKCPKCGGVSGYTVSDRVNGWEKRQGEWSGYEEVIDTDQIRYTISRMVRCEDCGHRVPRPTNAL